MSEESSQATETVSETSAQGSPEPSPSFLVDIEAFKAAAPEGYDLSAAESVLNVNQRNIHNLVKQNAELQKSFSSRMPVPDASNPEKMAEIYNKLGRPESAEGYAYNESINFTDDAAKAFLSSKFHELNVTNEQANGLLALQMQLDQQAGEQYEQVLNDGWAKTEQFIQSEVGALKNSKAYNDYDNKVDSALKYFGVDYKDENNKAFFASDAGRAVLKMAKEFSDASSTGKLLTKVPGISDQDASPGSLETRQTELYKVMVETPGKFTRAMQEELNSIKHQLRQWKS